MSQNQQKERQGVAAIVKIGATVAAATLIIPSLVQEVVDRNRFGRAMEHYKQANCIEAVQELKRVIETNRLSDGGDYVAQAKQKKAECDFFLAGRAAASQGQPEPALLSYFKLAIYENSALHKLARTEVQTLLNSNAIPTLASSRVCRQLGAAEAAGILPQSSQRLPHLYQECGSIFEKERQPRKALMLYQKLLQFFPDFSIAHAINRSLARATIAELRAGGAKTMSEPSPSGEAPDGVSILEIRNGAPAEFRLTASGPTPRFEQLKSCRNCQTYPTKAPATCPAKGPIGRYKLAPGTYDIAVKLEADNGRPVRPWTGTWNLRAGRAYGLCFFLVTDPDLEQERERAKQVPQEPNAAH